MSNELGDAFAKLLDRICPAAVVHAIDAGGPSDDLWRELEASGFLNALVPEERGGAGLVFTDSLSLVTACGAYAMPVPFAETMIVRSILARADRLVPSGPLAFSALADVCSTGGCRILEAAVTVAEIAGAAARVLELAIVYAKARTQFGRPIASFQAVQHHLSVMAEQTASARMAAELAFAGRGAEPDPTRVAIAKCVAGRAAAAIAARGHAVFGAIGITRECDLQLYTRRLRAWCTAAGSPSYWSQQVGKAWFASGTEAIDFIRTHASAPGSKSEAQ